MRTLTIIVAAAVAASSFGQRQATIDRHFHTGDTDVFKLQVIAKASQGKFTLSATIKQSVVRVHPDMSADVMLTVLGPKASLVGSKSFEVAKAISKSAGAMDDFIPFLNVHASYAGVMSFTLPAMPGLMEIGKPVTLRLGESTNFNSLGDLSGSGLGGSITLKSVHGNVADVECAVKSQGSVPAVGAVIHERFDVSTSRILSITGRLLTPISADSFKLDSATFSLVRVEQKSHRGSLRHRRHSA